MPTRFLLLLSLLLPISLGSATAHGITVLSHGKKANLRSARGVVRVAKDPALVGLPDPSCPTTSAVELSSYPQATQLVEVALRAELACEGWRRRGKGWRWKDPSGTAGVRRVVLTERKLVIQLGGAGYTMPAAPAAYASSGTASRSASPRGARTRIRSSRPSRPAPGTRRSAWRSTRTRTR